MTHEEVLLPYAVAIIGALFGLLVLVVGWVGSQISTRLETLAQEIGKVTIELGRIDRDLRDDLREMDARVARVEATCNMQHGVDFG